MKAFAPVRTAAPEGELLSLEEAKAHLKVEHDDEDDLVAGLVAAATAQLDGYSGVLGQALLAQEWEQQFDGFPEGGCLRLPLGPIGDEIAVAYYDAAGDAQTFTAFTAMTDAIGPVIMLEDGASWPSTATRPDAVTVTWECGRASVDDPNFPAGVIQAVKLMIGHWHANREGVVTGTIASDLPMAVEWLLAPHRKVGV